ncbi:SIR2 family NAD-dependent protein deacylase [Myxococcus xanthus]|uniref:SIR2 family protein n=1 Tax=Myxococcus xanthus TaxID=34 RepID=A0A7Y4IGS2_MYXXA|nr:SIR2 family protein [Myxococcus xanthus]NOJ78874.1 SIR2 family protein [Myxococcus xanthus]NOJ85689.1 SIR2 family protein [Myxococcus xanthus]
MNWDEFLQSLAGSLPTGDKRTAVEQCIGEGDLLTACEIARKALRPDVFKGELLRHFAEKRFKPAPIHKDIVGIDSRIVITTNFDKIYEMEANTMLHGDILVKNYYDSDLADTLRRQQRCVLKIHGTIDTPDKTIFTRTDYASARITHRHFYRALEALFMTHTFVFLGASMRDPDLRLILEDYAYRYGGTRPHFMVMPSGSPVPPVLEVLEESMNLRTICYDPALNHAELATGISELKNLVETERATLRNTLNW